MPLADMMNASGERSNMGDNKRESERFLEMMSHAILQNDITEIKCMLVPQPSRHLLYSTAADAIRHGAYELLDLILGCDPDLMSAAGINDTLTRLAVEIGSISCASILSNHGGIFDWTDCEESALHIAARAGHADFVAFLENEYLDLDSTDCSGGKTPLIVAVAYDNTGTALKLIQRGCNIYKKDYDQERTALHYAVANRNFVLTEELLRNNAYPGVIDAFGVPPITLAVRGCYTELLTLFIKHGACNVNDIPLGVVFDGPRPLETMEKFAETVVQAGYDLNKRDEDAFGRTLLMINSVVCNPGKLRLLLRLGANPAILSTRSDSVLDRSVFAHVPASPTSRCTCVLILLHGTNADIRSIGECLLCKTPPLVHAIEKGNITLANVLLDHNCSMKGMSEDRVQQITDEQLKVRVQDRRASPDTLYDISRLVVLGQMQRKSLDRADLRQLELPEIIENDLRWPVYLENRGRNCDLYKFDYRKCLNE